MSRRRHMVNDAEATKRSNTQMMMSGNKFKDVVPRGLPQLDDKKHHSVIKYKPQKVKKVDDLVAA
jgi:hypothetical protein